MTCRCGSHDLATRTRCQRCREEHNEDMRLKRPRTRYLAEGHCGDCGRGPRVTATLCAACRARLVIQYHARIADGLCSKCGKAPLVPGRVRCARCLEHARAAARARAGTEALP